MKVYLLTYNASYAGELLDWVKVYDSYNKVKIPQGMTDDEEIGDYLTNLVEFCHYGFSIVKGEKEDN